MPRAGPYDQHRDNQNVVIALGFAVIYPWLKRVTFWPQIGLGLAFSMAIPMAFTAYDQPLDRVVWALFLGNVAWTLAYDTLYAMVDRDDDLRIGVKSTAIMFGRHDLLAVGCSQLGRAGHIRLRVLVCGPRAAHAGGYPGRHRTHRPTT